MLTSNSYLSFSPLGLIFPIGILFFRNLKPPAHQIALRGGGNNNATERYLSTKLGVQTNIVERGICVQWYADFQQLPFFLSSGFNLFQEEFFLSGPNPQHIRSPSEVEATTMQQRGTYRLPDKEGVHYTFPKQQQVIIVIITQLSRGEARGVICEVVEDRSR